MGKVMTDYYAGIGAHKDTPDNILEIMKDIASHLATEGWTLRSGAADQSDSAFERGADRVNGTKEIWLPWSGYNHSRSELNPDKYPFTAEEIDFTAMFHPAWDKCTPSIQKLHQRNTRIIIGNQELHGEYVQFCKFVVCWTKNGIVTGGTGQGLRIATALHIPIFNLGKPKSYEELASMINSLNEYQEKAKTIAIPEERYVG